MVYRNPNRRELSGGTFEWSDRPQPLADAQRFDNAITIAKAPLHVCLSSVIANKLPKVTAIRVTTANNVATVTYLQNEQANYIAMMTDIDEELDICLTPKEFESLTSQIENSSGENVTLVQHQNAVQAQGDDFSCTLETPDHAAELRERVIDVSPPMHALSLPELKLHEMFRICLKKNRAINFLHYTNADTLSLHSSLNKFANIGECEVLQSLNENEFAISFDSVLVKKLSVTPFDDKTVTLQIFKIDNQAHFQLYGYKKNKPQYSVAIPCALFDTLPAAFTQAEPVSPDERDSIGAIFKRSSDGQVDWIHESPKAPDEPDEPDEPENHSK